MKEMKSLSRELRKAADILDHIGSWMIGGAVRLAPTREPKTREPKKRVHWTQRPENAGKVAAMVKASNKARRLNKTK